MNIRGTTALVLGGAGLVGRAVCRELILAGAGRLLVGGLGEAEARQAAGELAAAHPDAATELVPVWGNVFVRQALAGLAPQALTADPGHRDVVLRDALDELGMEAYDESLLVKLILGATDMAPGARPAVIVDAVNTATALAYGGVYPTIRRVLARRAEGDVEPALLAAEVDDLLAAQAIPMLVRHVQLASQAMIEAGTEVYVKIGTTGTGGMGFNIPYTHGEEKPSRTLLSKSALAGAHSMLLLLLARTPGAPAIKEIKPGAAITWKRIAAGPIQYRGRPMMAYDADRSSSVTLVDGAAFDLSGAGRPLGRPLESVFIDTGENGLFSVGEFSAITALGQMEAVTPEEIAATAMREIRGQSTGYNVVAALDGAIMGPSYRAGVLRAHALREARHLAREAPMPSVAFEILGPPRLSKLLFEAELLRLAFDDRLDAAAEQDGQAVAAAMTAALMQSDGLRQAAISAGIPVLLEDGRTLLAAARDLVKHDWERPGWRVDASAVEARCHHEWIDLRPEGGELWRRRAAAILAERDAERGGGISSSQLDRRFAGLRFGSGPLDIGELAAWVFIHEDQGERVV